MIAKCPLWTVRGATSVVQGRQSIWSISHSSWIVYRLVDPFPTSNRWMNWFYIFPSADHVSVSKYLPQELPTMLSSERATLQDWKNTRKWNEISHRITTKENKKHCEYFSSPSISPVLSKKAKRRLTAVRREAHDGYDPSTQLRPSDRLMRIERDVLSDTRSLPHAQMWQRGCFTSLAVWHGAQSGEPVNLPRRKYRFV